ncbi:ABC transporter ATP-binding protein [Pseudomonas sp. DP-17]|nr:ABC transporter ATP-binding protein [Pseudomonas sp. DP-17]
MSLLSLRGVSSVRGQGAQRFRLDVPCLDLAPGQRLALVGASGSGKSTLLDLLSLVAPPQQATRFDWRVGAGVYAIADLWRAGQRSTLAALRSRHCGYVLQTGGLLGYLSVRGNIELPRRLLGLADDGSVERLARRLDIHDHLEKKPAELSVGQRQRVGCARALAHRPALLLADEPTAALDPLNARQVLALFLEQVGEQQACCVIATHDEAAAREAGLRVLRLDCRREPDGGVCATLEEHA